MKKFLLILPMLLLLSSCNNEQYKTPLEWCYLEVTTNYDNYWEEDFDLPYSYKEIFANYNLDSEWYSNHNVKSVYNYEITVYVDDTEMIDVWYCGIAFNCYKQTYTAKQCVGVDCDWAYSIPFETIVKGDEE